MWKKILATLSLISKNMSHSDFLDLQQFEFFENQPNRLLEVLPSGRLKKYLLSHPFWFDDVLSEIVMAECEGVELLYPGHKLYPRAFQDLFCPPVGVYVQGNLDSLNNVALSIVGSREPDRDSIIWMESHLPKLVEKSVVIASGAARGIDQCAHRVCLRYEKPTIAFLPSGLKQIYPLGFSKYKKSVLDSGGALVSEYALDQKMQKGHFSERNRLISAISPMTFVVEAGRKSGSLITARYSIEIGRTLGVLSSHPQSFKGAGTLDLLFEGAQLIRNSEDLLSLLKC